MDKGNPKTQLHQIIVGFDLTALKLMTSYPWIFLRFNPTVSEVWMSVKLDLMPNDGTKNSILEVVWWKVGSSGPHGAGLHLE